MAHGIIEGKDNVVPYKEPAWHGLGTVVDTAPTSADALRIAKLDWTVDPMPIYCNGKEVPKMYGNVRSDTGDVLGIVTDKYKICQNVDAFKFTDNLIGDGKVTYESAGSLFGGKTVWMLARLEDRKIFDDVVVPYIAFVNNHAGKKSISCVLSETRVVCNNTLQFALKNAPRSWSVRHFSTLEGRLEEARETLGMANTYFDSIQNIADDLYKVKISDPNKFLKVLIKDREDASERIKNNNQFIRDEILNIFNTKNDLQNFRNTGWAMYQAVADRLSNGEPLRNAPTYNERRFEKQKLGTEDLLIKAQDLILCA